MSWSGSIHIKFYRAGSVSETLSILRDAGWGFYNDTVFYDYYPDPQDPSFSEKRSPVSDWGNILSLLDDKSENGETITLDFLWQGESPHITCLFNASNDLLILPDASIRLPGSRYLTDFSWLLARLVIPLANAGFDVESVDCHDSH